MVSVGPTTSMRMEKFEKEFIAQTGVKLIVVKAVWARYRRGLCCHKALHCVFPAGCAVVAAVRVEEIEDAQWRDLGMETLWVCRVKRVGPLIVSLLDTHGNNLRFGTEQIILISVKTSLMKYART